MVVKTTDHSSSCASTPLQEIDSNTPVDETSEGSTIQTIITYAEEVNAECSCECSTCSCSCHSKVDASVQTFDEIKMDHSYANESYDDIELSTQPEPRAVMSFKHLTTNTDCTFYTGLNLEIFKALCSTLKDQWPMKSVTMPVEDQILLITMRLRMGLFFQDLAHRFGISTQLASYMFRKGIPFMAKQLMDGIVWLPREIIRATLPNCFRKKYPNTTCIIDCTEIFIQRPTSLLARAQTYSNYKGHNTAKCLVAIAPNGLIMYQVMGGVPVTIT